VANSFSDLQRQRVVLCPGELLHAIATVRAENAGLPPDEQKDLREAACPVIARTVSHEFFHQFGADVRRDNSGQIVTGPFYRTRRARVPAYMTDFPAGSFLDVNSKARTAREIPWPMSEAPKL